MTKKSIYMPATVLAILLILLTAAMGAFDLTVQKWASLAAFAAILICIFRPGSKNVFAAYTTPLFLAVVGYIIWNGISVFYADVPKGGLFEFTKLIGASAVFLVALSFTAPTKKGITLTSTLISIATAFFGIVSIDAGSNGPIATAFKSFMGFFTNSMEHFGYFEDGIRITGIFGNANTFAGFMALGILLSLALVINSSSKKQHGLAIALLAINSLSYILLFSLGSLFMFMIACLIMIFLSKPGQKVSTFILMAQTALITLIFAAVSLITMGSSPWLPLAAVILNAVALWAVDSYVRRPVTEKITANAKTGSIVGILVIVLIIAYIGAALNVTGPLALGGGETVMRAAYPDSGEYKLSYEVSQQGESLPNVRIITQNQTDLKVHTSTELYNGSIEAAAFTVPEDSEIIKIYFTGIENGNTLANVACVDASTGSVVSDIKLDYKLLPAIAANRIQDLRANENTVQRIVFFEDGIKLFKQSPIIGKGLSGYETGVASVQNFFYETRYVHNHYIQALCDLGIIGFALFMSILLGCVAALVKLFKKSKASGYTHSATFALPAIAACIFQMFGQAITDLTWSAGPFLVIAFGILAMLITLSSRVFENTNAAEESEASACEALTAYAAQLPSPHTAGEADGKPVLTGSTATQIIMAAATLVMTILLVLNMYAHYRAASGNCTLDQMAGLTKIDRFEGDDYKTTYIVTANTYGLEENYAQADKFAAELTKNPDVVLNYLLPYYFNTNQEDKLFETASIAAYRGKAAPEVWNRLFSIFDTAVGSDRDDPVPVILHLLKNKDYFVTGLLGYYRDLQNRNAVYLDEVALDPGNIVFIGKLLGMESLTEKDLPQAIDILSRTLFTSEFSVDANNDHSPDNIQMLSGNMAWGQTATDEESIDTDELITGSGFDGTMTATDGTSALLRTYCVKGGEYTLRLSGLTGLNGAAAPRNISVFLDGQPVAVQYDDNGAFVQLSLKGATEGDEAQNIKASPASMEEIQISFPTGAQVEKVSLKR